MKDNRTTNRQFRTLWLLTGGSFDGIFLLLMIAMIQEGVYGGLYLPAVLMLATTLFTLCILFDLLPVASLEEEGVWVRAFFRKRLYPWDSIKQAGILWRWGRSGWYNQIVLLKEKGSPRRYRDKTFLLRNPGRVIFVPSCTEEWKTYVVRHYGPLDFDLSDGRSEQSDIADETL